ncbi:3'-5' exonuclease [Pseudoalteromonas sp. SWN166]|uniref:3'-5' exonuclease n=1 Tax=Pseudoalteromonas sp. SWN166 TaxID=2792061 RepID=UPI0018CD7E3C|nr:3'-5' exonuclease [Pseudoalteromonas sp. SWN166]MBH0040757.1 3'-5' exoribonuclease [Pseudoalteromonas sp. SWN166]
MTTQFFDLMIDTETAGLPPTGALMSIGAVFFDMKTQTLGPTFLRTVHLATSVRDGGTIDPSAFLWWLGQSDEARHGVRFNGQDIRKVLQDFSDWIKETCRHEDVRPARCCRTSATGSKRPAATRTCAHGATRMRSI